MLALLALVIVLASHERAFAQSLAWAVSAGGPGDDGGGPWGGASGGDSVAVDAAGNVYVVGPYSNEARFGGSGPDGYTLLARQTDVFIAKYDPTGSLVWVRRAGGEQSDVANSIAVTPDGECYVAGAFTGTAVFGEADPHRTELTSAFGDIFVAKYGADGSLRWVKQVHSPSGRPGGDGVSAIALDHVGNAYITGSFNGSATFGLGERLAVTLSATRQGVFVAKYDTEGNIVWAQQGHSNLDAFAADIAVDASGNSWATGFFRTALRFGETILQTTFEEMFLVKFTPDGQVAWARQARSPVMGSSHGAAVAVDRNGHALLVGDSGDAVFGEGERNQVNLSGGGGFVAEYDPNGALVWVARTPAASAVECRRPGEVIVAGTFSGEVTFGAGTASAVVLRSAGGAPPLESDVFVASLGSGGRVRWARRLVTGPKRERVDGLALDQAGSMFLTGTFMETAHLGDGESQVTAHSAGGSDLFVAKLEEWGAPAPERRVWSGEGWTQLTGIPAVNSRVAIENGSPGVDALYLLINGSLRVSRLYGRAGDTLDVASLLRPGDQNAAYLIVSGRKGTNASVRFVEPW